MRLGTARLRRDGLGEPHDRQGATIFPKLEAEARKAIEEDSADVICLGGTTMHQSHAHLSERLAVPVLNNGPVSYKVAELMLKMRLRRSKNAYPTPRNPMDEKFHAMMDTAARFPWPR
jgi:allantoin racemase